MPKTQQDELITLSEAAKLLPRVRGKYRHYTVVEQWCDRADLIVAWGPKVVYKSEFLAWARRAGKLPPESRA